MARRPSDIDGAAERARVRIAEATDAEELRVAQAVLLPLLGLTLEQTAEMIGRDRWWTSRARNRFLRGAPMAGHGGRRRALMDHDAEMLMVREAIRLSGVWSPERRSLRAELRRLLDEAGTTVAESTITRLLDRTAPRIVPGATGKDLTSSITSALAKIWALEEALGSPPNVARPDGRKKDC